MHVWRGVLLVSIVPNYAFIERCVDGGILTCALGGGARYKKEDIGGSNPEKIEWQRAKVTFLCVDVCKRTFTARNLRRRMELPKVKPG